MSTYILVHGSWHGAWCWYKIIPRLQAAGHKVVALDMPGHGRDWRPPGAITMQDYVDTITRALDAEAEPAVLVAHSRGGLVATHAAEARPDKLRAVAYLAGHLLPNGVRYFEWDDPESVLRPNVDINEREGWDMIRPEIYREALYHDCSDEDVALAYTLLTPEPRGPHSPTNTPTKTTPERFGRVRRVYIELTQDKAISWSRQKRMYTTTPCHLLLSIAASHSAYFSQPDELTRKILIAGGDLAEAHQSSDEPLGSARRAAE